MSRYDYDLVVVGSGPGGYVSAIRGSQLGLKTAIIEKGKPGGVCLNIGCIPSKNLIHQAEIFRNRTKLEKMGLKIDEIGFNYEAVFQSSRKAADTLSRGVTYLLKKNGIEVIAGNGVLSGENEVTVDGEKRISAQSIVIATGSRPRQIEGLEFDGKSVLSSDDALMLREIPSSMLIVGAGAIGCEFAHIFNAFGVKVFMVEMAERILPLEDSEITAILKRSFTKRGIEIDTGAVVASLNRCESGALVEIDNGEERRSLEVEKVLVVTGRVPNSEGIGLGELGLETERGFIRVGDYGQTACKSIYAIGDVVATPLLAHVASKEGEIAAESIAGHPVARGIDLLSIPGAVYCEPQVASFGFTEEKLEELGIEYKKGTFPYRGSGKAVALEEYEGMVKVLSDPHTDEILGAHLIGSQATELVHELLLAKVSKIPGGDIGRMIHAHPTLSETVMEVSRVLEGWAIHI